MPNAESLSTTTFRIDPKLIVAALDQLLRGEGNELDLGLLRKNEHSLREVFDFFALNAPEHPPWQFEVFKACSALK